MPRKRFPADQLSRRAIEVRAEDRASPPRKEVSLTDVVRAMFPNIQARREADHSFSRIADWLTSLGYAIDAATLGVYYHRVVKEQKSATSVPHPGPAKPAPSPADPIAGQDSAARTPERQAPPPVPRPEPPEQRPTFSGASTRARMPRHQA
ncbi:hypothetical protein BV96_01250 [Sphingomonas paucimobilis]|nr:hypothetical protein BV96_01250 [Sphingomonas paucimobilis]